MMQYTIQRCLLISLTVLLFACSGGDEITDFVDAPDLRLSSIEILSGGTLYFGGNIVEEFDPEVAGPYSVELDDAATSISLSVSLGENDNVRLELIEVSNDEDVSDTVTAINAEESVPVEIEEGMNLVYLRVSSLSNAAVLNYSLFIERESSSAVLRDLLIDGDSALSVTTAIPLIDDAEPLSEFFPGTYDVRINSDKCGFFFIVDTESRFTEVRINSELKDWREPVFIPLQSSETKTIDIELTPQNQGASLTYTFNLSKDLVDTTEDIAADTRLSSLEFSGGRDVRPYICENGGNTLVSYRLNELALLSLTAAMAAGRDDAVLTLGVDDAKSDELDIDEVSAVVLTSGVEYTGSLFDNLNAGSNEFLLRVDSADGENSSLYAISVVVAETNEVYVSTASELQAALQSATSNTEIVVASGEYEGTASVSASGHDNAHFYVRADIDGTADEPFILRAESGEVVLIGGTESGSSVLLIEGDYWQIEGISISGARNGVVVDSANGVTLENIDVDSVSERGIVFQNGTTNSHILGGSIDRTGLNPRDGLGESYGEGIVIGIGDGESQNNSVREVVFGRNISNEHIELKEKSRDTSVQFNVFESDNTLLRSFENRSLISAGGSAEISYNEFEFDSISGGTDDIEQLINVSTTGNVSVAIFQNYFDLDNQAITAVNNDGAGTVTVADNQRRDSGTITVSDFVLASVTPVYQIQSILDSSQCLSVESIVANSETVENIVVENIVVAVDCNVSLLNQQWVFVHTEQGYVHIVQNTNEHNIKLYLTDILGVAVIGVREDLSLEDDVTFQNSSYSLQWQLEFSGGNVLFSNRLGPTVYIVENLESLGGTVEISPLPVRAGNRSESVTSEFKLIAL